MKKNTTYVNASKFQALIVESELANKPQSAFMKVSGAKGRNVYVPLTKTVGRVDISGFTVEMEGVRTLDEDEKFGAVLQQIDFSRTEEEILSTFSELLAHL